MLNSTVPILVSGIEGKAVSVAAGEASSFILTNNSQVYAFGYNGVSY